MLYMKFHGFMFDKSRLDYFFLLFIEGMAAILVNGLKPYEQTFIPLIPGGQKSNTVTTGLRASEKKLFKNAGDDNRLF